MAWRTDPVGQRAELVALMVHGRIPVTELSALFGVSRKTAYKWRARYAAAGLAGLADASRRPQTHPAAMSAAVRAALVALRARYPQFGPKKLRHVFARSTAPPHRRAAARAVPRADAERDLDGRFQGRVSPGRSHLLLSADGTRPLQPLFAAGAGAARHRLPWRAPRL